LDRSRTWDKHSNNNVNNKMKQLFSIMLITAKIQYCNVLQESIN